MKRRTARMPSRLGARMAAAALALVVHLAQAAEPSTAPAGESPCRIAGVAHEVRCGRLQRPLDPARPQGPSITLQYVVIPAKAQRKLPDPVLLLAGGPGQSAIDLAGTALALFARLNHRRDIVLIDQRGTGRSAPLRCPEPPQPALGEDSAVEQQLAQLETCRRALEALPYVNGADGLRHFTTTVAMADVDAVRRTLGAPQVNLVGGSYGTRAALEYLRQFPQATRRVVLDGVAPPDMALPASLSRDGQAAFDALLAACAAEPACTQRHPSLAADWQRLLARLPQRVTVADPLTGHPTSFTLTRSALLGAVRGPLYAPALAAALPEAIAAAAQGRFEPLAGLNAILAPRPGTGVAVGMHFSVVCAEDVPRLAQSADTPGRDFGTESADLYRRACARWPRGEVPAAFYEIARSDAPVLLLSGGLDPVTPPRHGERVAKLLGPRATHRVVANSGHGVLQLRCMADVVHRFIDAADADAALTVDTTCADKLPRPPMFEPLPAQAAGAAASGPIGTRAPR